VSLQDGIRLADAGLEASGAHRMNAAARAGLGLMSSSTMEDGGSCHFLCSG